LFIGNLFAGFQNCRDCHWPAFKSGGRCVACFSIENCSLATYLPDFKTEEIASGGFSKALSTILRHLSPNRSKGFELPGFEKLLANSKAFGAKPLRTY
jgi:hypothetical protein